MDITRDSFIDCSSIDGNFPNDGLIRCDNRELYLSVCESPYKATKYDATEMTLTNQTVDIDTTVDSDAIDKTIVISQRGISPVRETLNNINLDPLSITTIIPETPNPNKLTENIQDGPSLSNNKENTAFTPLELFESSSDNFLTDDSKLFLESDSSGIDSLLIQSMELSDTSDVSAVLNSVKKVNSVLMESQSNNILHEKNHSKSPSVLNKLIFDSTIGDKIRFNTSNVNLNESLVKLQRTHDANFYCTDFRDVANKNVSFNSMESEQLLKSMKDELRHLLYFIKVISAKNAELEQENNLLQDDKKEMTSSLQKNCRLQQNRGLMKQKSDYLCSDLASPKTNLTSAEQVKSYLLSQVKESENKLKSTEKKLLESKEEINEKYNALKIQFEEVKEALQRCQRESQCEQCGNNEILTHHHEPCRAELMIKEEEISSLTARLKMSEINRNNEEEKLKKSIEEINEKYLSLQNEFEKMKESLIRSQSQLQLSRDQLKDLSVNELEPCRNLLLIKAEEISSLKSQLEQSDIDYNKEKVKFIKLLEDSHGKYLSLENELEVMKDSLVRSQNQLKSYRDELTELKLINESLQNEMDRVKSHNDKLIELNNELNKNKKLITEESDGYKSKLGALKNENLLLSKEIDEFKYALSKVLNLNNDISVEQILTKFKKQFYEFTLVDELLEKEKSNSNRFKVENVMLKERIDSLSHDSAILEQKLSRAEEDSIKSKEELSELKLKYDRIDNLNRTLFIENVNIESEFKNYKEKYQHFLKELQYFFDIPSDSFEDVNYDLKQISTEIVEIIQHFADFNTHCTEMKSSIEKNGEAPSIDLIFNNIADKCTSFKIKSSDRVALKNKKSLRDNLYLCLDESVSLLENNLSLMKIYLREIVECQKSSDCAKTSNSSFSRDSIHLLSSELKEVQSPVSPRDACSDCEYKQTKLDEMAESLVDKVAQVSSLESVVDYWKARYYRKSDNLDSLSDKFSNMRKRLSLFEKENITMKEELLKKNTKTEKMSVAVQCQESQSCVPPPNFVQICKINELRRKVEKLSKINLSLKEQTAVKDKKNSDLTTDTSNTRKTSP